MGEPEILKSSAERLSARKRRFPGTIAECRGAIGLPACRGMRDTKRLERRPRRYIREFLKQKRSGREEVATRDRHARARHAEAARRRAPGDTSSKPSHISRFHLKTKSEQCFAKKHPFARRTLRYSVRDPIPCEGLLQDDGGWSAMMLSTSALRGASWAATQRRTSGREEIL